MAIVASSRLKAQEVTLEPGTALRIELDHAVRSHVGASVRGHLTEPVYLVDHQVIPAGALVFGSIRGMRPGPTADHIRRLLAADFTPPRVPDLVFTSIAIPANGAQGGRVVLIDAPAVETQSSVLTLGTKHKRQSLVAQVGGLVKGTERAAVDRLKHPQLKETVEKYVIGQLPYHPEFLWSKTRFNADMDRAATLPDMPHSALILEDLHGRLPEGALHARLISPLTSENAKRGDPVEAVITRPLLSPDGTRLLVAQGTHLHGIVVRAKAARSFGRNGDLRITFRSLDLSTADQIGKPIEIHGRLSGAETAPGQHVTIDEEGEATASDGPGKYAEPLVLAVLAGAARPDDDHHGGGDGVGPGAQTVSSNGFGLIARVVSLTSKNTQVLEGFAYYSLAKSLYYNFIAKGHQTTFPRDTEVQVTLSER
jgi:hypothetical protein